MNRGYQRSRGLFNRSSIQCRYCGIFGHFERECRKKMHNQCLQDPNMNKHKHCNMVSDNNADGCNEVSFFMPPIHNNTSHCDCALYYNHTRDTKVKLAFYLDSGCNSHMTNNLSNFEAYIQLKQPIQVYVGIYVNVTAVGQIRMVTNTRRVVVLNNVCYLGELSANLISVSRLDKRGFKLEVENGKVQTLDKACKLLLEAFIEKCDLYKAYFNVTKNNETINDQKELQVDATHGNVMFTEENDWHQRLAHLNFADLKILKNMGLIKGNFKKTFCEPCVLGKQSRKPVVKRKVVAIDLLVLSIQMSAVR